MANEARYMPLYVDRYLADTAYLPTIAHGAYLLLIMNYWQRGKPLPASDRKLALIARLTDVEWASIRDDIAAYFIEENGEWRHPKIDTELRRAAQKIDAAKRAGEASANARAQAKSSTYQHPLDATPTHDEQSSNYKVRIGKEDNTSSLRLDDARKRTKGTRLPEDWSPFGDDWDMADSLLGEVQAAKELSKFRDYWRAVPGSKGVKLDWPATWRNWVRKAAEQRARGSPSRRQNATEAADEILAEWHQNERTQTESHASDVQRLPDLGGRHEASVEYLPPPRLRTV